MLVVCLGFKVFIAHHMNLLSSEPILSLQLNCPAPGSSHSPALAPTATAPIGDT